VKKYISIQASIFLFVSSVLKLKTFDKKNCLRYKTFKVDKQKLYRDWCFIAIKVSFSKKLGGPEKGRFC
jgi:hypothetical protein